MYIKGYIRVSFRSLITHVPVNGFLWEGQSGNIGRESFSAITHLYAKIFKQLYVKFVLQITKFTFYVSGAVI